MCFGRDTGKHVKVKLTICKFKDDRMTLVSLIMTKREKKSAYDTGAIGNFKCLLFLA